MSVYLEIVKRMKRNKGLSKQWRLLQMWLHNVDKQKEIWMEMRNWKETNSTYFLLLLDHKGKEVDVLAEWAVFISTENKEIKTSFDNEYKRTSKVVQ